MGGGGGSPYDISIIRNGNVTLSNSRKPHVALSNLRTPHVAMSNLFFRDPHLQGKLQIQWSPSLAAAPFMLPDLYGTDSFLTIFTPHQWPSL